jgi:sec-independent protein translocase protein TatA
VVEDTTKEKPVFLGNVFGPDLVVVIVVVAVLIFGGSAIPKLARNLGQAKNEFEKGLKTAKTDAAATDASEPKAPEANQ